MFQRHLSCGLPSHKETSVDDSTTASLENRLNRLQRVIELSLTLNSTLQLEPLLELIIQTAQQIIDTQGASILLLDQETGELRFRAVSGHKSQEIKQVAVSLDNSIAGYILRTGASLIIPDVSKDPRFGGQVDSAVGFKTRSLLGVPLTVKGRTIGVLEVVNKANEGPFTEEDAYVLTTMAAQAAIALENSRLITELQKAYEELNHLDRLKSEFIAVASHELRTPLAVILGYVTYLQRDATGDLREQLDVVVRSALRLRSLIDDMTNLRHIDAGEVDLQLEQCDFVELVQGVVNEFASLSAAKRQTFNTHFPAVPLSATVDRDKLRLALGNILSNAVKFTPEGGTIDVETRAEDARIAVSVRDTGVGIAATELKRIFDRFYQTEPAYTRRFEGMGLGLSIARSLVEIHGGSIEVESQPGRGSTFTICLSRYGPPALSE
jgi:signal transduction histidine kinase